MEMHEQDNVAIGRHWLIFIAKYDPLVPPNPRVEEALLDETFHA
jgi:hypothetical protein